MRVVCVLLGAAALLAACSQQKTAETPAGKAETPAAGSSAPAPVAGAPGPAKALIERLNAMETTPAPDELEPFFTPDMVEKMRADMLREEVGVLGYDYRWNAQDYEITKAELVDISDGPDRGRVVVSFTSFGQPGKVTYDMCRRPDGQWRIYDVRSHEADDGSLRHALGLKRGEVTQC